MTESNSRGKVLHMLPSPTFGESQGTRWKTLTKIKLVSHNSQICMIQDKSNHQTPITHIVYQVSKPSIQTETLGTSATDQFTLLQHPLSPYIYFFIFLFLATTGTSHLNMWLQLKQPGCQDESISVVHIRYCWSGDRRVQQPPSKTDACTEESMSISISGSAITYSMILSLLDHLLHDLIICSMILSPTPWFYHYLITYSMILSLTPFYHLQSQQVQMQEKGCSCSSTLQSPQPHRKKVVGEGGMERGGMLFLSASSLQQHAHTGTQQGRQSMGGQQDIGQWYDFKVSQCSNSSMLQGQQRARGWDWG